MKIYSLFIFLGLLDIQSFGFFKTMNSSCIKYALAPSCFLLMASRGEKNKKVKIYAIDGRSLHSLVEGKNNYFGKIFIFGIEFLSQT